MRARRHPAGFTTLEVALTTVVFLALLAAFVAAHKTTRDFTDRTYTEMRANEEHQRNLAALADLLRGASATSLTGFDASGASIAPSFQSVTGADATGRILGPVQSIAWRASALPANGGGAGEIALDVGGVKVVVASHVPAGGFVVRKSGNTLRVTLTTVYTTNDQTTASVTGDVSVSLRN